MKIYPNDMRRMIDCSLLRNDVTVKEVEEFIAIEKKERFICAFVMPCYVDMLVKAFKDEKGILVGGAIGFPTGAEPTNIKIAQACNFVKMGVDELDLVINIGWLKSEMYDQVLQELKDVIAVAQGKPVKVILEVTTLTDDEIRKGSELVIASGADFIKTGTGFMKDPTTLHHVEVIRETVGERIKIKAAGGIRDFDTFIAMIKMGVCRFGISWQSAVGILQKAEEYPGGIEV